MNVTPSAVNPKQWVVADYLASRSEIPKTVLWSVFDTSIRRLEDQLFLMEPKKLERVWDALSSAHLPSLQRKLTQEYYKKILCMFEPQEIEVLEQQVRSGGIRSLLHRTLLNQAEAIERESVTKCLAEKAKSRSGVYSDTIVRCLINEKMLARQMTLLP